MIRDAVRIPAERLHIRAMFSHAHRAHSSIRLLAVCNHELESRLHARVVVERPAIADNVLERLIEIEERLLV